MDIIRATLGFRRLVKLSPDMAIQVRQWFNEKELSTDWASRNYGVWADLLSDMRYDENDILEIGSWEGRSAVFFLNFMPRSRITCIDTFAGDPKLETDKEYPAERAELRFDTNLSEFVGRVEKIKSRSVSALDRLGEEGRCFDLIYVDGSHHCDDVLIDSLLCWPMLKEGGILIWDDYRWRGVKGGNNPGPAIDCFIKLHRPSLSVIWRGYQVAVKKRP